MSNNDVPAPLTYRYEFQGGVVRLEAKVIARPKKSGKGPGAVGVQVSTTQVFNVQHFQPVHYDEREGLCRVEENPQARSTVVYRIWPGVSSQTACIKVLPGPSLDDYCTQPEPGTTVTNQWEMKKLDEINRLSAAAAIESAYSDAYGRGSLQVAEQLQRYYVLVHQAAAPRN